MKHIYFGIESNEKDPKFKNIDYVKILKYSYVPNCSEVFMIKKLKILCRRHMLLVIVTVKKLLECFKKMNCKRQIKVNLG